MPINNPVYSPKIANQRSKNILRNRKHYPAKKILGFEKLMFKILTKFSELFIDNYDEEIEEALKLVVDYLDFDLGSLAEYLESEDTLIVTHFYETNHHTNPELDVRHIRNISLELPEYTKDLKKGKVLVSPIINEETEDRYILERDVVDNFRLKSAIALPISIGGKFTGLLSLVLFREERSYPEELIAKLKLLSEIFGNIIERKKSYERMEHISTLGELVSSISASFINLSVEEIDKKIEMAMQKVASYMGIERVCLFQYSHISEDNSAIFKTTHYWNRYIDEKPSITLSKSNFPWCYKKIMRGQILLLSHIDEIPKSASIDRKSIIKNRTKSLLVLPLTIFDGVDGLLSFENVTTEKIWTTDLVSRARILAQSFSSILSRKNTDIKLHNAYKEIEYLKEKAESENIILKGEIALHHEHDKILGRSNAIRNILGQVEKVAKTDSSVLILGETGTGKGLLAREIHRIGLRKDRPLIEVNCGALHSSLMESELFGHEKGAFTGASERKLGRFEIADGSTLFLDEIGEIPLELQAKLLRVLQEGKFERIGGTKTIEVDVRVIAATNRDLSEDVRDGKFRQDLFYRLKVFPIWIPPLRDRVEDIPDLAMKFIDEFSEKLGKKIENIPRKTIEMLKAYLWPGNVRELRNIIEHAIILSDGKTLNIQAPQNEETDILTNGGLDDILEEYERKYILKILNQTRWRVKGGRGAAEILKMNPSTLFYRMTKLGIPRRNSADGF